MELTAEQIKEKFRTLIDDKLNISPESAYFLLDDLAQEYRDTIRDEGEETQEEEEDDPFNIDNNTIEEPKDNILPDLPPLDEDTEPITVKLPKKPEGPTKLKKMLLKR